MSTSSEPFDYTPPPEWGGCPVVESRGRISEAFPKRCYIAEVMWGRSNYIVSGTPRESRAEAMAEATAKVAELQDALEAAGKKVLAGLKIAKD